MKRSIVVIIAFLMVAPVMPVFASRAYSEEEVTELLQSVYDCEGKLEKQKEAYKVVSDAYIGCIKKNSELMIENEKLKSDSELSPVANFVSLGIGVWGILNFASTGTLYPFATGCLFIWGALK